MKFIKINKCNYISADEYKLHQMRDGSFSIVKGNTITKWGNGFQTVRSAEIFLNNHDYIHASTEFLPLNSDDIDFITDFYGFDQVSDNEYRKNDIQMVINPDGSIYINYDNKYSTTYNIEDAINWLDSIINYSDVFAKVVFRGSEFRNQPIFAALRPKDLTRVKSSNVWAVGIEVNDKNRRVGDLYVQYKAKNGGPGDCYRYYDIPVQVYRKLISAPSKGAFLWKYIRHNFQYSKLTGNKRGVLPNAVN